MIPHAKEIILLFFTRETCKKRRQSRQGQTRVNLKGYTKKFELNRARIGKVRIPNQIVKEFEFDLFIKIRTESE